MASKLAAGWDITKSIPAADSSTDAVRRLRYINC